MNSNSQIPKNLKSKESKLNERRNKKKIENSIKNTQKVENPNGFQFTRSLFTMPNTQEYKRNDLNMKRSTTYHKNKRFESELDMRKDNKTYSFKERVEEGFLEMRCNFKELKTRLGEIKTGVGEIKTGVGELKNIMGNTNEILVEIRDALVPENKRKKAKSIKSSSTIQDKEKKVNIPLVISNDNNLPLHSNIQNKNIFPGDKNSINYIDNNKNIQKIIIYPREKHQITSVKNIEGYNRIYKRTNEPMDSQRNNSKYIKSMENISSHNFNKNTREPLDNNKLKSNNKSSQSMKSNYSNNLANVSKIDNFISNSNKSSEEEFVNLINLKNDRTIISNENSNVSHSKGNNDDFHNNYSKDSNNNSY